MKRDESKDDFCLEKMLENPQTRQMKQLKMFRENVLFGRIILDFSFECSESSRVFNYLHDSHSIFRAAGINTEIFLGRMVIATDPRVWIGVWTYIKLRGCAQIGKLKWLFLMRLTFLRTGLTTFGQAEWL